MKEHSLKSLATAAMIMVAAVASTGCANKHVSGGVHSGAPVDSTDAYDLPAGDNHDPLEILNRGIFKFNEVLDGLVLKPVAHIYLGVVPEPVRHGVTNVLTNLSAPVVFVNSALQGDKENLSRTAGRFLVNSTVGIGGIFDMAKDMGIPKEHKKDFGQTFGVWGIDSGPYIYLPIFGPSSVRDALGMVADTASDPFTYILSQPTTIALDATRTIDRRADLLPLTDRIYRDSLDPYASIRSMYQQYRVRVVSNYLKSDTAEVEVRKKK